MKKVFIKAYISKNLGDDLFIKILTDRYKNKFICSSESKYLSKYNDNICVYNNLFILLKNHFFSNILKKSIKSEIYDYKKKKSDIMVNIGGSIFEEYSDVEINKNLYEYYNRIYRPYYILGANFGPYKNEGFVDIIEEKVFNQAEDICFRDEYSYNKFKHLKNVRKASDIVFSLNIDKYKIESKNQVIISVIECYRRFSKEISEKYEQKIVDFVEFFVQKNYNVILMSFCKNEGDEKAIKSILGKVNKNYKNNISQFMYNGNIDEALNVIAKTKIVVGSRFHSNILGMLFKKVVIPISYSNKTINTLNDLNFKGKYMDINNLDKFNVYDLTEEDLKYKCDVSNQKKSAESHFKELDKVLQTK